MFEVRSAFGDALTTKGSKSYTERILAGGSSAMDGAPLRGLPLTAVATGLEVERCCGYGLRLSGRSALAAYPFLMRVSDIAGGTGDSEVVGPGFSATLGRKNRLR